MFITNRTRYGYPVKAAKRNPSKVTRTSRTRAESMTMLQEAALTLLLENHPDNLTVRDIAELAGAHFRYIPDYFGGKAELFASIYPRVANEAAEILTFPFAAAVVNGISPQIVRHARLAIWLSSNHPDGVPTTDRPLQHRLMETLITQFGIDDAIAKIVSERLIALVIVLAAFPDVVTPEPIDVQAHIALEMNMLASYVQK